MTARKAANIAVILVMILAVDAFSLEAVSYLKYKPNGEDEIQGDAGKVFELEIDKSVKVTWDRGSFLFDLATELDVVPPGDPIADEINALETLIVEILTSQAQWVRVKSIALKALAEGRPRDSYPEWEPANDDFGKSEEAWTERVMEWSDTWGDPRLEDMFGTLLLDDAPNHVMAEAVQQFIELRLGEIAEELAARVAAGAKVAVQMEGRLRTGAFGTIPVHLDGYDHIEVGDPTPFNRFQIAVDKRTMAELEAADKMGKVVKSFVSGEFKTEVTAALKDLDTALTQLKNTLRSDVLIANLDQLINDLESSGQDNLGPTIDQAKATRDWAKGLADMPVLEGGTDIEKLASLSRQLDQKVRAMVLAVGNLPTALRTLVADAQNLVEDVPNTLHQDTMAALGTAADNYEADHGRLFELYTEVKELAGVLGFGKGVAGSVDDVARIPREIREGQSLDTYFDLQTIRDAERHPGDRFQLNVKVFVMGDEERMLVQERQDFLVQVHGPYVETRGALLFVDPRSEIERDISFQPTVGLGIHMKWGIPGAGWWNDWLRPGIGVSFAILDFQDRSDFELGVAGSITMFKDLFWTGYGRNLQAKADYFYLAVNPLAIPALK